MTTENYDPDSEGGQQATQQQENLLTLGIGGGSKNEALKAASALLRGEIAAELENGASSFSEPQVQLLKFHGTYQQDDRDQRKALRGTAEKAYQLMVRTRIPGGVLTAEQYLTHDELAGRYANGTLRITTRQGLQLHGVLKSNLRATIREINETLLSTLAACGDVNRNVMACPAPTASRAHAQVEAIANAIAQRLAPNSRAYHEIWIDGERVGPQTTPHAADHEPVYGPTYLPRKFKIGVAFPGDNCVDVYTQDIGLIATLDGDEVVGFTVVIGGGLGMTHGKTTTYPRLATPFAFVTPERALDVVEAIVTIQRDHGDRQNRKHARMKYLVAERGIAWFRAEVERRLGYSLDLPRAVAWGGVDDHLGWHRQGDGRWFLGLFVENGRVADTERVRLRTALREVIARFRPGVRLTGQQNILLTDLKPQHRAPLRALLARHGVVADPAELGTLRLAMACPALPTCGQALAEAERALPGLIREVQAELGALGLGGEPLSVRMTGCPNGCARPYMGDVGLVGRSKDLYTLFVGGDLANTRLNTLYADAIPFHQVLATLRPLFVLWRDGREPGETFGDFCHRVGVATLRERAGASPVPMEV